MKRILMWALLPLIATVSRSETKQALILHMNSGVQIVYFLDDKPSIGFISQDMSVTVGNETTDIPMQDVNHWNVGVAEYSEAIPIADKSNFNISICGNTVNISNPASTEIHIYNIKGVIVGTSNMQEASFSLTPGIYVVKAANNIYKIATR